MNLAILLVSLFLSPSPDCLVAYPATFANAGTVTGNLSVCLTSPPFCGVSYNFALAPASTLRVNSRVNVLSPVDTTQPQVFPFNVGSELYSDLGFSGDLVPYPAVTSKEIARYNLTHTGMSGITYSLKLTGSSMVAVSPDGGCQNTVDVPYNGKLPPLSGGVIHN